MRYELWDMASRSLIEEFNSEAEALAAALELIALNPDVFPAALALAQVDRHGQMTTLAAGDALAERARNAGSARLPA